MRGTIKLINPIMINGKMTSNLDYDTEEITAAAFARAESNKAENGNHKGNMAGAVEIDYSLHLYLGFAAVEAVNPEVDIKDLERVKGYDVMQFMRIGRAFISGRSEESSPELSEDVSETTPELSAPQPQTSESSE